MNDPFHDSSDLQKSRAGAMAIGAPTFFSGMACKYGHISTRRTLNSACVACDREHASRQKLTPEWQEYRKQWVSKNSDKVLQYKAISLKRTRERLSPAQRAKLEEGIASRKATAADRKQAKRQYNREYRILNHDKVIASIKAWRLANPEYYRNIVSAACLNRRARKLAARGRFTGKDIDRLLRVQKFKCCYCMSSVRKQYHIDHIMPLVLGGSNMPSNLQILCPTCNLKKGGMHPVEYAQRTGRLL